MMEHEDGASIEKHGALEFVMDRISLAFTAIGTERFDAETVAAARAELSALRRERDEMAAKLRRVRDWIKYAANSEGGIVEEIDSLLDTAAREAMEGKP